MAFQGEREPGVLGMDGELLESMAQDEIPEQEMMVVMQEQVLPQPNPEPEMGAAAAAAYDTSPPLPRQIPSPTLGGPTPDGEAIAADPPDMGQLLMVLLAEVKANACKMDGIKTDAKEMKEEMKTNMDANMQTLWGEMQKMGRGLQAGIVALACNETRTAGEKMATPCAGTNELGRACNGCQARNGGG